MMNINDVVSYGPIAAADEETGCLVTVNGAYVNLWVPAGHGLYSNVDCRSGHPHLDKMTASEMIDRARECLEDWLNEGREEE